MTWISTFPAMLFACLVVIGPGLLATAPLRVDLLTRVAVSSVVGVCVTGLAAIIFGAIGLPLSLWQVLAVALVGLGLALVVGRMMPPRGRQQRSRSVWLVGVWVLSIATFCVVTFSRVPSPDRISQTYDNVFHLSAVAAIRDGFSASPLTLRSLIETNDPGIAYYPSAWHSLVALTAEVGVTVPVAFNLVWIAVIGLVWLPGIAWLARVVLPIPAAPIVALPLGIAMGWYPYGLLTWGTIYPTALAHALLPTALGIGIMAARVILPEDAFAVQRSRRRWVWRVLACAALVVVIMALAFAHPRVLPTWLLVLAPYVLWRLGVSYRWARHAGGRAARAARHFMIGSSAVVLVGGVGAFSYAVFGLGLFDEPLSDRLNGPQARATQSIGEGILQVVLMSSRTGVQGIVTWISPLVAAAVIVGTVFAVRRSELRWLVVSYVIAATLFVLAAGSDDDVTKLLTGVWYKDGYRLAATLPILAVPLATMGVIAVARRVSDRHQSVVAAATSLGVAASGALVLSFGGVTHATEIVFHEPPRAADREVVSRAQIEFLEEVVPTIVPTDQRLLGDPWDGSALSGLYADREPVFPHVNGQWDRQRRVLAWLLDGIDTDPEVCASLDALRVRYMLYNPHAFGGGDPAGNHFPAPHAAAESGLFTEVATDGESILFRIDQCGPLE